MKSLSGWTLLVGAMSRCIFGVVFGSFSFLPVLAQQPLPTLLVDVDHRPVTSLDGPWHYLVDQSGKRVSGTKSDTRFQSLRSPPRRGVLR